MEVLDILAHCDTAAGHRGADHDPAETCGWRSDDAVVFSYGWVVTFGEQSDRVESSLFTSGACIWGRAKSPGHAVGHGFFRVRGRWLTQMVSDEGDSFLADAVSQVSVMADAGKA